MNSTDKDNTNEDLKGFRFRLAELEVVENFSDEETTRDTISRDGTFNYLLGFSFNVQPENNIISILVRFKIDYLVEGIEKRIIDVKINNKYDIPNIEKWITKKTNNEGWIISDAVGHLLANESLAQSRGVHAYLLRGKPLDGYYMPFTDVDKFYDIDSKEGA